jgi:hypothetical protein
MWVVRRTPCCMLWCNKQLLECSLQNNKICFMENNESLVPLLPCAFSVLAWYRNEAVRLSSAKCLQECYRTLVPPDCTQGESGRAPSCLNCVILTDFQPSLLLTEKDCWQAVKAHNYRMFNRYVRWKQVAFPHSLFGSNIDWNNSKFGSFLEIRQRCSSAKLSTMPWIRMEGH